MMGLMYLSVSEGMRKLGSMSANIEVGVQPTLTQVNELFGPHPNKFDMYLESVQRLLNETTAVGGKTNVFMGHVLDVMESPEVMSVPWGPLIQDISTKVRDEIIGDTLTKIHQALSDVHELIVHIEAASRAFGGGSSPGAT